LYFEKKWLEFRQQVSLDLSRDAANSMTELGEICDEAQAVIIV
jgi:hypothetical protein